MVSVYLVVAREDDWETSTKIVGLYGSIEEAKDDLSKQFRDIREGHQNEFLWENKTYTRLDLTAIEYLYGDVTSNSLGTHRHQIVILEQKINFQQV